MGIDGYFDLPVGTNFLKMNADYNLTLAAGAQKCMFSRDRLDLTNFAAVKLFNENFTLSKISGESKQIKISPNMMFLSVALELKVVIKGVKTLQLIGVDCLRLCG